MPSRSERISPYRLAVVVLLVALVAGLVAVSTEPLGAEFVALAALVLVFLGASVFDAVREHPLYDVASAAHTTVVFGVLYLSWEESVFALALAGLSLVGVAVELYNYRHGTSYLEIGY